MSAAEQCLLEVLGTLHKGGSLLSLEVDPLTFVEETPFLQNLLLLRHITKMPYRKCLAAVE